MEAIPSSTLTAGLGPEPAAASTAPMTALLDYLIPGFSIFSTAIQKYAGIDINLYIPAVILLACVIVAWRYFSDYFGEQVQQYLMSVVDIRTDDEIYNMLMAWVAAQRFSQGARRFVANTNLNSRMYWYMWHMEDNDDDDEEIGEDGTPTSKRKKKALSYTPTFGSHWFFYKGRVLIFKRQQPSQGSPFYTTSDREEISISCFGRNPWILKELLQEARMAYLKRDEAKTLIYRGAMKGTPGEPTWQRCMARTSRPFSTVILNEEVKQNLIKDVTDYLNPATRRWYSNRGIPYRRGYLLHGPPGTGKSSLSLALAGFFKMRIYIVSLSSITSNEENLAALFAELPRRCVVLLEDIDSAGLTHARDEPTAQAAAEAAAAAAAAAAASTPAGPPVGSKAPAGVSPVLPPGRLTLSGLLNILDGVASQEGRVLIMTTNHLDKLDSALIRPGRVDMIVKFDKADTEMTAAIFRAIYAPLEGDDLPTPKKSEALTALEAKLQSSSAAIAEEEKRKKEEEAAKEAAKQAILEKVDALAKQFASKVPPKEFSPAEIQGFLLKNKRDPQAAVDGAETWVVQARKEQNERAAKEQKEAEEKRKKEAEEKAKKEKEEAEKKKEEEEKKAKKAKKSKKSKRKSKKEESESDSDSGSGEETGSETESEEERKRRKKKRGSKKAKKQEKGEKEEKKTMPLTPPLSGSETDRAKIAAAVVVEAPTTKTTGEGLRVDTEKAMGLGVGEELKTGDSGYGEVSASVSTTAPADVVV
ncbi:BCS1 N terminal-domain-containing protein [Podospora australis]|uniref:BCS1 N terminal-domain-containing protein n=1 Tax=Podospora australis TaxID=1536484 RepID=A0AAN6X286_9PEZI|nr:BCS1 N terminal-domain-containing protein [Podospora australis]